MKSRVVDLNSVKELFETSIANLGKTKTFTSLQAKLDKTNMFFAFQKAKQLIDETKESNPQVFEDLWQATAGRVVKKVETDRMRTDYSLYFNHEKAMFMAELLVDLYGFFPEEFRIKYKTLVEKAQRDLFYDYSASIHPDVESFWELEKFSKLFNFENRADIQKVYANFVARYLKAKKKFFSHNRRPRRVCIVGRSKKYDKISCRKISPESCIEILLHS